MIGCNIMINAIHLIWIVPLSVLFGFCLCGIFTANDEKPLDDYHIKYDYKKSPDYKKPTYK